MLPAFSAALRSPVPWIVLGLAAYVLFAAVLHVRWIGVPVGPVPPMTRIFIAAVMAARLTGLQGEPRAPTGPGPEAPVGPGNRPLGEVLPSRTASRGRT